MTVDKSEGNSDRSEGNLEERRIASDASWVFMLLVLFTNLVLPFVIATVQDAQPLTPFLLALAAFAFAFAIHFSAVSATICGIYIREQGDRRQCIRDLEIKIVTSAHLVLAGGLAVILSSGLYLLNGSCFLWAYSIGAVLLFIGVCKYFFTERGWPRKIIRVLQ